MKITLSKSQWEGIGKKAGWMKIASSARDIVMNELKQLVGPRNDQPQLGEKFDPKNPSYQGSIWFGNEGNGLKDGPLYDTNIGEFHPALETLMAKHGWSLEPYDGGTLFAFPNTNPANPASKPEDPKETAREQIHNAVSPTIDKLFHDGLLTQDEALMLSEQLWNTLRKFLK